MRDNFFIDSNVALYALDNDGSKNRRSKALIADIAVISPQIIFECLNVCIRKLKFGKEDSLKFVHSLFSASVMQAETEDVVITGLRLYETYSFQVFDSKIVASALVAGCSTLYSEDMQHGLVIDDRLTIINPFL